MNLHALW